MFFGPHVASGADLGRRFIFGAKKIPELAKTFGKAKGEYKKGEIEADEELKKFKEQNDGPHSTAEERFKD